MNIYKKKSKRLTALLLIISQNWKHSKTTTSRP